MKMIVSMIIGMISSVNSESILPSKRYFGSLYHIMSEKATFGYLLLNFFVIEYTRCEEENVFRDNK